jgi:hypothetical protein
VVIKAGHRLLEGGLATIFARSGCGNSDSPDDILYAECARVADTNAIENGPQLWLGKYMVNLTQGTVHQSNG